jgi:hypothetical protein
MDDQIKQTPTHPLVDVMPTQSSLAAQDTIGVNPPKNFYHHNKKKILRVLIGIVILVIIAIAVEIFFFHHKKVLQLSPEQTLGQLEGSSKPVTATPTERATALSQAQKTSMPYTMTSKQKMAILNASKN